MNLPLIHRYLQCERCESHRIVEANPEDEGREREADSLVCLDCGNRDASEGFKCFQVAYRCECGSTDLEIRYFDWDSEYLELVCLECSRYTTW